VAPQPTSASIVIATAAPPSLLRMTPIGRIFSERDAAARPRPCQPLCEKVVIVQVGILEWQARRRAVVYLLKTRSGPKSSAQRSAALAHCAGPKAGHCA
jgi:hypothetical protein